MTIQQINAYMYGYESNHKPFTPVILHPCGSFYLQYFTEYCYESPLESRKVAFCKNITMMKYAFKIKSFLHHFNDVVLLILAFTIGDNTN